MGQKALAWFKPFDKNKVSSWSFDAKDLHVRWFEGGKLNVSYNCLDRHLKPRKNKSGSNFRRQQPQRLEGLHLF